MAYVVHNTKRIFKKRRYYEKFKIAARVATERLVENLIKPYK